MDGRCGRLALNEIRWPTILKLRRQRAPAPSAAHNAAGAPTYSIARRAHVLGPSRAQARSNLVSQAVTPQRAEPAAPALGQADRAIEYATDTASPCHWARNVTSVRFEELATKVRAVHNETNGAYGSPRVCRKLRLQGEVISEKTVAKVMRIEGIVARKKRRHKTTTDSRHTECIADNLLQRNFVTTAPNQVWATDVTAIWSISGWIYLAAMLDLFRGESLAGQQANIMILS